MKKLLFSLLLIFVCDVVAMDVVEEDFGSCKITKTEDWFIYNTASKYFPLNFEIKNILTICEHIFTSKTSIALDVGITDDQFELLEKLYKYWLGYYAHQHIVYHKDLSHEVFCNDRMIDFITENYGDGKCITNVIGLCFRGEKESLTSEVVQNAHDYFLDAHGEIFQYLNKVGHLPVELVDIIKQYVDIWELHQNCDYKRTTIMIPKWIVNCFVKRELWNRECRSWSSTRVYKDGQYILLDDSTLPFTCYDEDDCLHQLLADVPTIDLGWSVNGMSIGNFGWQLGDGWRMSIDKTADFSISPFDYSSITNFGYKEKKLPIVQFVLKQHLNEIRLLSLSNSTQNCNNELIKSFLPIHNDDCVILGIVSLAGLGVLGNLVWYEYQGKDQFMFCA